MKCLEIELSTVRAFTAQFAEDIKAARPKSQ